MTWRLPNWWRRPGIASGRPDMDSTEADPVICFCRKVRRSQLEAAIRDGARSVTDLTDQTRAGSGCGTCRIDLIALLEASDESRRPE